MRCSIVTGAAVTALLAVAPQPSLLQAPAVQSVDETALREYAGVYRWAPDAYLYLQMWNEFTGFQKPSQLVAFDESGEVRALYPTDRDRFFAGPGAAVSTSVESRIEFQRDQAGRISALTWRRDGASTRTARRVEVERHEEVRFSSGNVQLAGTLTSPSTGGRHPAIILVHGSAPRIASTSFRSPDSWSVTGWPSSGTTSAVPANRPGTGRWRRSTTLPATSSPHSSI
jgi:hypothetical protein